MAQLTHHHKSVRSLTIHPTEFSFASGSAGGNNIKKWKCPEGTFVHNFSGHDAIINTVNVNVDGVFFSGGKADLLTYSPRPPPRGARLQFPHSPWLICLRSVSTSRQWLNDILGLQDGLTIPDDGRCTAARIP